MVRVWELYTFNRTENALETKWKPMETKSINPAVFHVFSYAVMLFFLDSAALRPITNFFFANKGSYKMKMDKNIFVLFGFDRGTLFSCFCSIGSKSGLFS